MSVQEFISKHGIACGGNWSQMLMSSIRRGLPKVYSKMVDRPYEFEELMAIIKENVR